MRKIVFGVICTLTIMFCISIQHAYSQNETPVRIAFDTASERIDLLTGEKLQNYTTAQRGSIQFFRDRLDTPEKSITFYHDGMKDVSYDQLILIEKVQPEFSIWRLRYKNGSKNTPRLHIKAVSFIPLDANGTVEKRVYVLLDDLSLIEWGE